MLGPGHALRVDTGLDRSQPGDGGPGPAAAALRPTGSARRQGPDAGDRERSACSETRHDAATRPSVTQARANGGADATTDVAAAAASAAGDAGADSAIGAASSAAAWWAVAAAARSKPGGSCGRWCFALRELRLHPPESQPAPGSEEAAAQASVAAPVQPADPRPSPGFRAGQGRGGGGDGGDGGGEGSPGRAGEIGVWGGVSGDGGCDSV
jgi:hypothetical protein